MNEKLKQILILLYQSSLFYVVRRIMTNHFFIIILYHEIQPELFEEHIKIFRKYYNIINLHEIYDSFKNNKPECIPPHSLVITFDDGWKSNVKLMPMFKKYGIKPTIFLATGLVNTKRKVWYDIISPNDKEVNDRLKTLENSERERYLLDKYDFFPEREYNERSMLNLEEIENMKPFVDFQSHGVFHSVFTLCSESELESELKISKTWIERTLKTNVYAIAYPYGWTNKKVISQTKKAGYKLGRIANFPCLNNREEDIYRLKSVGIKSDFSIKDIEGKLARAHINTFLIFIRKLISF